MNGGALMTRQRYQESIQDIRNNVAMMGRLAKDALWLAVEAVAKEDGERITAVQAKNKEIDSLEFQTETRCMLLIATQQPVGKDLRILGTCLKILSDFDRLGDLAGNIAKIAAFDFTQNPPRPSADPLLEMTNLADSMLTLTLRAFENNSPVPLDEILALENKMDDAFRAIREAEIELVTRQPQFARASLAYAFIARYLERIADHICNIASRIHYMQTGERVKIE